MFLSRGDRDLGVAFQTHPGRQAFISSGSILLRVAKSQTRLKELSMHSHTGVEDNINHK